MVNKQLFSYTQNWCTINYLIPIYSDSGKNQTLVGIEDCPSYCDYRRLKTVLNQLASVFSLNLPSLRQNYGQLVQRKNKVPLGFHPRFILIPVHTRTPVTKDDGATGYVVLSKITSILSLASKAKQTADPKASALSRIIFADETWLDVQQQVPSLYKIKGEALEISQAVARLYANALVSTESKLAESKLSADNTISASEPNPYPQNVYQQINITIILLEQILRLLNSQLPAVPSPITID